MGRDRLTRSSTLRALAFGAIATPLWVAWSAASCLLVDPPPELPTLPKDVVIVEGSVVPPVDRVFSNWPAGGLVVTVPVLVLDPTVTYPYFLIEDYGTAASAFLGQRTLGPPDPEAGGLEFAQIPAIPMPSDSNCHTFTVFVGLNVQLIPSGKGVGVSAGPGSDQVSWFYNPSGGLGTCATFDAAGLTDNSPDAGADAAPLDGFTIPVDDGH